MYWDELNNRSYVWRTDKKFRMFLEKKDELDANSWVVKIVWNYNLEVEVRTGLSFNKALKAIKEESWRYPRESPEQIFLKHYSREKLEGFGFFENPVPLKQLQKIAGQIYGNDNGIMETLLGGRDAPVVEKDGTIVFGFFAGRADMNFFGRIPGVIAANGYELINYFMFGGSGGPTVYIKLTIKKKEKK